MLTPDMVLAPEVVQRQKEIAQSLTKVDRLRSKYATTRLKVRLQEASQEATSDDLTASQVKGGQEYPREDVKAVEAILGILEERMAYSAELVGQREELLRELRELTRATLLGSIVAHVLEWEREDAHLREQAQSARNLASAYEALEQSQKSELMRFLGEYHVKVYGATRPLEHGGL